MPIYTTGTSCAETSMVMAGTDGSSAPVAVSGLNSPATKSGSQKVVTYTTSAHSSFTFYVKSTFDGGQVLTHGPYVLYTGCVAGGLTATNNMVTSVSIAVGASTTGAYTFALPTPSLNWCTAQTNTLYKTGDVPWTTSVRLTGSGN